MTRARSSFPTRLLIALALLMPLAGLAHAGASPERGASPAAPSSAETTSAAAVRAQEGHHRPSNLRLDLVSREYDSGTDTWTIVADATLSSNRICLPLLFNCIVSQISSPSNATLSDLQCLSDDWNHLLVFRNHCLKQLLFAGHDQKFRFTYVTDPGTTDDVVIDIEFGRGVLPDIFNQLATAELVVSLDVGLDVTKECPEEVDASASLTCTITVDYPEQGEAIATITDVTVTDTPDSDLDSWVTGGALNQTDGSGAFSCTDLVCDTGALDPGQSATFEYTATVTDTPTGGTGQNDVSVTWAGPGSGGPVTASDEVTVVGSGDTDVEIDKTTEQTEVTPGAPISWTVTVTNAGDLPALNAVVTDIAPDGVDGMTLTYVSGVGDWSCSDLVCSTASMPVGSTTFVASGTVASDATAGTTLVNEVEVGWDNDILGPDFPITAGSDVSVVAAATTTTTTTTAVPDSGAGLSFVG